MVFSVDVGVIVTVVDGVVSVDVGVDVTVIGVVSHGCDCGCLCC